MIRALLLLLFPRAETPEEARDRFYNGHAEAKRWERIGARVTGSQIVEASRHGATR